MRAFVVLALSAALFLGCGKKQAQEQEIVVDISALEVQLKDLGCFVDELDRITKASVLTSVLTISASDIERYSLYMGTGYTAEEFAVFCCADEAAADRLVAELTARVEAQKEIYKSYRPDAIPRLNNAIVSKKGRYVAYVVAERYSDAKKIVDQYFK